MTGGVIVEQYGDDIEAFRRSLKKASSGGKFLKRVPNEGIEVRFRTEPNGWLRYYEHYNADMEPRSVPCTEDCPRDEIPKDRNNSRSVRWLADVVDVDAGRQEALSLNKTTVGHLMKYYDKFGTLMDRTFTISKDEENNFTVMSDGPSRFKDRGYKDIDLMAMLEAQLPDSDDEEDEEVVKPARPQRKTRDNAPGRRRRVEPLEEDEPDEDDEDDDEQESYTVPTRRRGAPTSKVPPRKMAPRKSASKPPMRKRLGK